MNIFLWILQGVMALHTLAGAVWKLSHTAEQTMPSLGVIPPPIWSAMGGLEVIAALFLIAPLFKKRWFKLVPIGAGFIVLEMIAFCNIHLMNGTNDNSPIYYWVGVALISAIILIGRLYKMSPKGGPIAAGPLT
ncbi:DoxX family protein [Bdellovibrio sp. HCB209]|uniref:DoxX family protein n=1 Tax=Bdellovibrio sp. HCB209 TaxID=3394354 RepID=UPI0039B4E740